ncbi:MAG: hypothetical protein FK734_01810 [Asgard group archaeon]|nr:hypothetical protein [Asgard group archaeon]
MAAPAISHLIGTIGFIVLIFVLPLFYFNIVQNVETDVISRELQEIVDYTSSTVENLYFLVNSTNSQDLVMEKELVYLPTYVEESVFQLELVSNETDGEGLYVRAVLKNDNSVEAYSWLIPGLRVVENMKIVESIDQNVFVGCSRNVTDTYIWIR